MMGELREIFIEKFLKSHLPNQLTLGRGFIIDSKGQRSKQQDIVLYRADMPKLNIDKFDYFLIEGVIATIEVKTRLTQGELISALHNSQSVQNLDRLESCGPVLTTKKHPTSYIFSYEAPNQTTTIKHLSKYAQGHNITNLELPFDVIVSLQQGFIAVNGKAGINDINSGDFVSIEAAEFSLGVLFFHMSSIV